MKRTYKNIQNLSKKVNQLTLGNILHKRACFIKGGWDSINDLMTDEMAQDIADLLGGQTKTKSRIIRTLTSGDSVSGWFLERIVFSSKRNRWEYIAGQDYPAELAEIRKQLS